MIDIVEKENKIVRLSIMVLCFALIFVYLIWFYVKWDELEIINTELETIQKKSWSEPEHSQKNISISTGERKTKTVETIVQAKKEKTPEKKVNITVKQHTPQKEKTNVPLQNTVSKPESKCPADKQEVDKQEFVPSTINDKMILSGTILVESSIDVAEVLGIKYKYALKDAKGIEYLYLGKGLNNDFVAIINQYDWTLHRIDTEYEIKKHELFGERVLFLNLPGYHKKVVLMIVKYNDQYWLLSIDYAIYHKSKKYLKDLFNWLH